MTMRTFFSIGCLLVSFGSSFFSVEASTANITSEEASPQRATAFEEESQSFCSATTTTDASSSPSLLMTVYEQILAHDYEGLDPVVLSQSIDSLKQRGAHRCWHKHSTFLEHLLGTHNILRLWGQGRIIGRVGLFHSAYSNSYVNLALYDPETEREIMRELIGETAEELVHMFCIIDRQEVVINTLLKQGYIPAQGLEVPHIRDPSQKIFLDAETLRMLVVFTMADTSDQYFGWQDSLFGGGGQEGSMIIPGQDFPERHDSTAIWPGISKPGLWMSYISQLARVAQTFQSPGRTVEHDQDGRTLDVPPVFANGTEVLSVKDEAVARDLYWSIVSGEVSEYDKVISTLRACTEKNPWAFEPYVVLTQKLLHRNDFDGALEAAGRALDLQHQWGTAWDKRLSFDAWVAWTRVLYQRAQDRLDWPTNSWDVNNFGLVR